VDYFLNWGTAKLAREAYDTAVSGTEIYTLDRFGPGALPFDLVLPEHGRGTLRVTLRAIHVETPNPIRIPLYRPVKSVQDLAAVLAREFGSEVALVGKAVTLISMLATEYMFVFSEEGSGYLRLTRKMNDRFMAGGIGLGLHPILRLKYQTWDALEVGQSSLSLPEHLESTLASDEIPSGEFASRWESGIRRQQELLAQVRVIRSPRDLLRFLSGKVDGPWEALAAEYAALRESLKQSAARASVMQSQVIDLYSRLAEVKRGIVTTEKAKGDHFRSVIEWTPEHQETRSEFAARIADLLAERRRILLTISELKASRLETERTGEGARARIRSAEIEIQAESARLTLVRNAILAIQGLPHTQHRPSAWWIPMVDRTGGWFRRIAETTELYTEELLSSSEYVPSDSGV
jgi:hypothetical protein